MLQGDVQISPPTLALFTTMMMAVVSALIAMFWLAWHERDKSYQELKTGCDQRYNDMRAERDRVLAAQQEQERNMLALLGVIRDGVTSVNASVTSTTAAVATVQRLVEQLGPDHRERR